jgi:hypothetical protein
MRLSRAAAGLSGAQGVFQAEDLRRRVAGCRDRLRRNRAARRMTGRVAPSAAGVVVAETQVAADPAACEGRKEKG